MTIITVTHSCEISAQQFTCFEKSNIQHKQADILTV